jgi:hypothetical protein
MKSLVPVLLAAIDDAVEVGVNQRELADEVHQVVEATQVDADRLAQALEAALRAGPVAALSFFATTLARGWLAAPGSTTGAGPCRFGRTCGRPGITRRRSGTWGRILTARRGARGCRTGSGSRAVFGKVVVVDGFDRNFGAR